MKTEVKIVSKYYTDWEEYKKENPIVEDIEDVCTVQEYEDLMLTFVCRLFY
ncbi:hypothetical protein [Acetobacterium wieringae]|uniref:hypothetical protein n=1 Tax=Acetobacterium wieringae TaxID=52694 RepID=UPI001652323D|nr:hypothetical protein [Acetobacterium wieringae]MEA4806762.1 hypothetical protein [Acetobacterium wieringae]